MQDPLHVFDKLGEREPVAPGDAEGRDAREPAERNSQQSAP
jgi:hypothetical protein